ncbi:hypothetical protein SGB_03424 [Shigella boydii ATCC 9905]|nr:hypothetical protein SGB_03424 [Shigella boydii ATCC 9905]
MGLISTTKALIINLFSDRSARQIYLVPSQYFFSQHLRSASSRLCPLII